MSQGRLTDRRRERISMSIVEKVPSMSNDHLANLLTNARRMVVSGTAPQQAVAAEVISAAEAETAVRRAAHLEVLAARRAAAPKKPSTRKAKVVAEKVVTEKVAAE
jgi:hypothetical protein